MQKIPSFTVNHLKLNPGVYVSRKDAVGNEVLTTFDIRMKAPQSRDRHVNWYLSCHRTHGGYIFAK